MWNSLNWVVISSEKELEVTTHTGVCFCDCDPKLVSASITGWVFLCELGGATIWRLLRPKLNKVFFLSYTWFQDGWLQKVTTVLLLTCSERIEWLFVQDFTTQVYYSWGSCNSPTFKLHGIFWEMLTFKEETFITLALWTSILSRHQKFLGVFPPNMLPWQ